MTTVKGTEIKLLLLLFVCFNSYIFQKKNFDFNPDKSLLTDFVESSRSVIMRVVIAQTMEKKHIPEKVFLLSSNYNFNTKHICIFPRCGNGLAL